MSEGKRTVSQALESAAAAVDHAVKQFFLMLMCFMTFGFVGVGVRNVAEWLVERGWVVAALIFVLSCGAGFFIALSFITPENSRGSSGKVVKGLVWGLSGAVALAWVYIFAVLSYVLLRMGLLSLTFQGPPANALPDLTDAYLWYFFELVPLFDINDAFAWRQPDVDLTGGWSGMILLLFRIVMVVQVFGLARMLLEKRSPDSP
jgi:hypothetical protein